MATPLTILAVAVPDTRDNIGILGKMEGCIAALSKYQISKFFAQHAPTTQEACNQEAEQCIGGSVHPAPVQGATSYTVVADDDAAGGFVVQFRADDFALDLGFLARVEQAYRPFMPHHQHIGIKGGLHLYTIDNVGGKAMYLAADQLHWNNCYLLRQTLQDFARSVDN